MEGFRPESVGDVGRGAVGDAGTTCGVIIVRAFGGVHVERFWIRGCVSGGGARVGGEAGGREGRIQEGSEVGCDAGLIEAELLASRWRRGTGVGGDGEVWTAVFLIGQRAIMMRNERTMRRAGRTGWGESGSGGSG